MKIYTKGGDKGKTSLLGGTRVLKSNLRIDAYGTIDELNAHIGLLRDHNINESAKEDLLKIQNTLFIVGSILACEVDPDSFHLPKVQKQDVTWLEQRIDKYEEKLPELKNFILPGGHKAVSQCHIVRCVSRRAERFIVLLNEEEVVDQLIIQYLNRLSDYFFMLARKIGFDLEVDEIPWSPGR